MSKAEKLRRKIMESGSDANVSFDDLRSFLLGLGFEERIRGSHHNFRKSGIVEKPNLQKEGNKAKGYQVRQVRSIVRKYGL